MKRILYLGLNLPKPDVNKMIVHFPIIKITPVAITNPSLKLALDQLSLFTHCIFTSQTSVKLFFKFLNDLKFNKTVLCNSVMIAVGQATAASLRKEQVDVKVIAREETAEGIIAELKKLNLKNSYIFWPRSALARPILSDYLKKEGILYHDCILYHTSTQQPGPLPDLSCFDEIIFTSPSTVDAFKELFSYAPAHVQLTPIGPVTRQRLASAFFSM